MNAHTAPLPASEAYKLRSLRFARGQTPQPSRHIEIQRPAPDPAPTIRTTTRVRGRRLLGAATA